MPWVYDSFADVWKKRGSTSFVPHKNLAPIVNFTHNASNLDAVFDGTYSYDPDGTIIAWQWFFGDGKTGTGPQVAHSYTAAGTYNVQLIVTDNAGLSASKATTIVVTNPVVVNQKPTAKFTYTTGGSADPWRLNVDGSTSFDSDGNIAKYHWDFGNGVTYDSTAPVANGFYYTADGTYTVTLTVTDDDGATASTSQLVTVKKTVTPPNNLPVASFTLSQNYLVVSVNAGASTDPDGNIVSYAWTFGDGGTGSGVTASHTYVLAGTYNVTLTVTDNLGGVGTKTQTITVSPQSTGWNPQGGPNGVEPTASDIVSYRTLTGADPTIKLDSVAVGKKVSLPPSVITFNDFAKSVEGGNTAHSGSGMSTHNPGQILGSGVDFSVVKMNPGSTTKTTQVGGTTRLQYWQLTGTQLIQDCTLLGIPINGGYYTDPTPRNVSDAYPLTHNIYNGFFFRTIDNFTMRRVKVSGVPGTFYSPPGETFPIATYHGSNHLFEDCEVDGQHVAGSGIGINYTTNVRVNRYYAHDSPYAIGFTSYGAFGTLELDDVWVARYRAGINLEANALDVIYIRRPKFENCSDAEWTWWGNVFTQNSHSCRVEVHDPICIRNGVSGQKMRVRNPANYGTDPTTKAPAPNNMLRSDVHVFINGVEKLATDYIQWL